MPFIVSTHETAESLHGPIYRTLQGYQDKSFGRHFHQCHCPEDISLLLKLSTYSLSRVWLLRNLHFQELTQRLPAFFNSIDEKSFLRYYFLDVIIVLLELPLQRLSIPRLAIRPHVDTPLPAPNTVSNEPILQWQ